MTPGRVALAAASFLAVVAPALAAEPFDGRWAADPSFEAVDHRTLGAWNARGQAEYLAHLRGQDELAFSPRPEAGALDRPASPGFADVDGGRGCAPDPDDVDHEQGDRDQQHDLPAVHRPDCRSGSDHHGASQQTRPGFVGCALTKAALTA